MITVELRSTHHRFTEVVTTLEVRDDDTYRVTGSRSAVNLSESMVSFPGPRVISFYDDPWSWARALPHNLTSPYLHAVIVQESPRTVQDTASAAG